MPKIDFPVNPIRDTLYSRKELFSGFKIEDENSFIATLDFNAYLNFKLSGGSFPNSYYTGMMRSLHDFSIWNGVQEIMKNNRIIAVMGDHNMGRSASGDYAKIAKISYALTQMEFLLSSGGGPGAMEATHLGAYFSNYTENDLEAALNLLSQTPNLPDNLKNIIKDNKIDQNIANEAHRWIKPVFEIINQYPNGGNSISMPTWLYGHEPTSPFASHIAKYFQNSIREDGLLAIAKFGVIYAKGKAGTIQEIFQDATQNFYLSFDWFSPMVFLGKDYWEEEYPIKKVLDKLFTNENNSKYVLYTDEKNEIIKFITDFKPTGKNKNNSEIEL